MRFVFIQAHARIWHVRTMCRVLQVSRAGYYAWRARPLCARVQDDRRLTERIRQIQQQVEQRYGSPRVRMELRALGVRCAKKRVARLMRAAGLQARHRPRGRRTTQSGHAHPVAPNVLNRQFAPAEAVAPNRVWAADITYLPTREGWLYLAVVLDLFSRRVVGWALRPQLAEDLTLTALRMALQHRQARGGLHHSDRGGHYASTAYRALLAGAGFTASMSRPADCWDNAVVESFFATLTKELLHERVFPTRDEGCRETVRFIECWYNRQRRHSTLGYHSPAAFEALSLRTAARG